MADSLYSKYAIFGAFFISLVISYLITPLFRLLAIRFNFLDHPQVDKKVHSRPTPLLGGLAIFSSFFITVMLTTRLEGVLVPIFLGSSVLILFGMVDDRLGMMPNVKLTGQFIAALIVIRMGVKMDTIQNHYFSLLFSVLWIVGMTNSFNLLDNLNGLSSGIAAISAAFFGIIALKDSQMFVATLSFALAGACLGFLKHNFPRARIFMGDTGSMFIGFTLACIAIIGCWKTETISISLSLPIFVLSYPIFDTTLVTIIRILEKRPVFIGGRDHSSHILASLGFKKRKAVLYIYFICVFIGLCAYIMSVSNIYAGFSVMALVYLFLISLGIYLIRVRLYKYNRRNHIK